MTAVLPDLRRREMRRSIWCEGCGLGNLQEALSRALVRHVAARHGLDPEAPADVERIKDRIALVSGIGCTSRMPGHLDLNTLHTTHGRSLAFASGLKMARPDLTVALAAGDGDVFAIGGNHLIHAARRNLDLTLVVYDNRSYGMTGAQHSPTSPLGERGASAPFGVWEPPVNLVDLAIGAGASFVAQAAITTRQEHQDELEALLEAALGHAGFAFVNVVGFCHTGWGARNARAEAFRYRRHLEAKVLPVARWRERAEDERAHLHPLGILHRVDRPDLRRSDPWRRAHAAATAGTVEEEPLIDVRLGDVDPLLEHPRTTIRFAGSGGQGVITAGEITLHAALEAGRNGVYTKNYGPEARGGEAYSDVTVSAGEIHFPQAETLDVLVALNQETFDRFRKNVAPGGTIIANSTAVRDTRGDARVVASPIGELLARDVRPPRRELGINIVALALALGYLDLVPRAAVESAVMSGVGRKNPGLNQRALAVGFSEAERLRPA